MAHAQFHRIDQSRQGASIGNAQPRAASLKDDRNVFAASAMATVETPLRASEKRSGSIVP